MTTETIHIILFVTAFVLLMLIPKQGPESSYYKAYIWAETIGVISLVSFLVVSCYLGFNGLDYSKALSHFREPSSFTF